MKLDTSAAKAYLTAILVWIAVAGLMVYKLVRALVGK